LFRTGWFIESLATQTLVILIIRTRGIPWRSRPSRALVISITAAGAVGVLLPFTPLAGVLGFVSPPLLLLAIITLMVIRYLAMAEVVKRRLYSKSHDLEMAEDDRRVALGIGSPRGAGAMVCCPSERTGYVQEEPSYSRDAGCLRQNGGK
jgi:hypothetical protein